MDASRSTDASPSAIGFIGDLADPWIAAIADALATSREVHRVACAGTLPDRPFGEAAPPRAVVIQRHRLSPLDVRRVQDWRARAGDADHVLILCISPYVRYEELERSSGLFDGVFSEATAAEVLPGQLARALDGRQRRRPASEYPGLRIEVAGGDDEWCRTAGREPAFERAMLPGRSTSRKSAAFRVPLPRDRSGSFARARADHLGSPCSRAGMGSAARMASSPERTGDCTGGVRRSRGRRPRQGERGRRVPGTALRPRRSGRRRGSAAVSTTPLDVLADPAACRGPHACRQPVATPGAAATW